MEIIEKGVGKRIPYEIRTTFYESFKGVSTYITMDVPNHELSEIEETIAEIKAKVKTVESHARLIIKGK